jgi:hypothetical protein
MIGYTKLHSSILASTIWRQSHTTRIVWITLLALANKDGVVEASVAGLADLAKVTISEAISALIYLTSCDPDSRTTEFGGKRIQEVDGGWVILNYRKYRGDREPRWRYGEEDNDTQKQIESLYAAYPKKVGRGRAYKAIAAALRKTDLDTLMAGVKRYAFERSGQDPKYTAHPATWFYAERWADDPNASKPGADDWQGEWKDLPRL